MTTPASYALSTASPHARVAGQLGVSESDVIFAEPDVLHNVYQDANEAPADSPFAAAEKCEANPQDGAGGKAVGPDDPFPWHLGANYSQLGPAREAVQFDKPRTRIAHLDTGYYRAHEAVPENVLRHLERSFVGGEEESHSSEDPDNRVLLLDNSGHGTGTLGILAGRRPAGNVLTPEAARDYLIPTRFETDSSYVDGRSAAIGNVAASAAARADRRGSAARAAA